MAVTGMHLQQLSAGESLFVVYLLLFRSLLLPESLQDCVPGNSLLRCMQGARMLLKRSSHIPAEVITL